MDKETQALEVVRDAIKEKVKLLQSEREKYSLSMDDKKIQELEEEMQVYLNRRLENKPIFEAYTEEIEDLYKALSKIESLLEQE